MVIFFFPNDFPIFIYIYGSFRIYISNILETEGGFMVKSACTTYSILMHHPSDCPPLPSPQVKYELFSLNPEYYGTSKLIDSSSNIFTIDIWSPKADFFNKKYYNLKKWKDNRLTF